VSVLDEIHQKAAKARIPLAVHFDLTYRCHQRCVHCYLPESWRRGAGPGPELDTAGVTAILDQMAAAGTLFLSFSGGEIFQRPDLLSILTSARRLNFSVSLMTSGINGPDRGQMSALADLGLEGLYLSLYSLEAAVNDRVTGLPGSWEKAWRTLQACRNQKVPLIINCTALTLNFLKVAELKRFADQEGFRFRLSDQLIPRLDGLPHPPGLILGPGERRQLAKKMGTPEADLRPEPIGLPEGTQRKTRTTCRAGFSFGYISPRGMLQPCLEVPWVCGQLPGEASLADIWQKSATLGRWRHMVNQLGTGEVRACDYLRKQSIKRDGHD
jgi:MoaA/NifB/PqqE/SkfB family radical SAM enzyme